VVSAIFVYGTLMPGRLRWGLLSGVAVSTAADSVAGQLFDTGSGWPAARFGGNGSIPGWVVGVLPVDLVELLPVLDEVETGFRRVQVRTAGGLEAWGYEVAAPPAEWVAIDRWEGRAER
jgi:gamma-glutamylcyclotransferase (GGCT)/AIG2-like uncharacterized protein YtfP